MLTNHVDLCTFCYEIGCACVLVARGLQQCADAINKEVNKCHNYMIYNTHTAEEIYTSVSYGGRRDIMGLFKPHLSSLILITAFTILYSCRYKKLSYKSS